MNTVFQRCVNYALQKVCFHNTPWCVNLHTPKTHLIMCYFKDKRCVGRTHHGVFWEHTCFYSVLKMKAVFSQRCVFQRCVFSKMCFLKGVFLKGVLLSKSVFWNTPF